MNTNELPFTAQAKLTAIRLSASDARALADSGTKQIANHREREQYLLSTLRRLESGERNLADIDATDAELKAVRAEIERITAQIAGRQRRVQNDNDLMRRIESWLSRQKTAFEVSTVDTTPKNGESLPAAIERVRDEISRKEADRTRVQRAPLPANDLKALMRGKIDALAERGRPRIYGMSTGELRLDLLPSTIPDDNLGMAFSREVMEQSMAWLHRETLIARLEVEIDASQPDAKVAVSAKEKARREAEFPGMILALEREEESLIEKALASGLDVLRRSKASPEAVLGIVARQTENVVRAA